MAKIKNLIVWWIVENLSGEAPKNQYFCELGGYASFIKILVFLLIIQYIIINFGIHSPKRYRVYVQAKKPFFLERLFGCAPGIGAV
jgi:hypothetical protein